MKKVVILGAAGGIGRELVAQFVNKGFQVCAIDLVSEFNEQGIASYHQCDVTDKESLYQCFDRVREELGEVDIVICSQGLALVELFENIEVEGLQQVMEVNFYSVVYAADYWHRYLEGRKTQFCVIGSIAGLVPSALLSAYCASKFALNGFIESVRLEWELKGSSVKINHIAPGFIDTRLVRLGEKMGFPKSLRFILGDPKKVSQEIVDGIMKNRPFFIPTMNGKVMNLGQRLTPRLLQLSSKYLARYTLK